MGCTSGAIDGSGRTMSDTARDLGADIVWRRKIMRPSTWQSLDHWFIGSFIVLAGAYGVVAWLTANYVEKLIKESASSLSTTRSFQRCYG